MFLQIRADEESPVLSLTLFRVADLSRQLVSALDSTSLLNLL